MIHPSIVLFSASLILCKETTIHGFAYWVRGESLVEKLIWVAIVIAGFVCSSIIVSYAIQDWLQEPGITVIKTFSKVFASSYGSFSDRIGGSYFILKIESSQL